MRGHCAARLAALHRLELGRRRIQELGLLLRWLRQLLRQLLRLRPHGCGRTARRTLRCWRLRTAARLAALDSLQLDCRGFVALLLLLLLRKWLWW